MNKDESTNEKAVQELTNIYMDSPDSMIMSIWEFLDKGFARERIEDDYYEAI